jgi:hypothetical protein
MEDKVGKATSEEGGRKEEKGHLRMERKDGYDDGRRIELQRK